VSLTAIHQVLLHSPEVNEFQRQEGVANYHDGAVHSGTVKLDRGTVNVTSVLQRLEKADDTGKTDE
jgi:hypothetical protein